MEQDPQGEAQHQQKGNNEGAVSKAAKVAHGQAVAATMATAAAAKTGQTQG